MRKVTETVFVRSADLADALARWITENTEVEGGAIEVRTLDNEEQGAELLRGVLQGYDAVGARLTDGPCDTDPELFELGLARCGGWSKVGGNAMIRAVLAAVCDRNRKEPIGALHTRRFELLMGTRNATSLRAWIRRMEDRRSSAPQFGRAAQRKALAQAAQPVAPSSAAV